MSNWWRCCRRARPWCGDWTGSTVDTVAALERRGVFAERGYKSAAAALGDLLGWERFEARRRVVAAEQVTPRVGLDGTPLPARLPATAAVFAAGRAACGTSRSSPGCSARPRPPRLSPEQWAGAEDQLAAKADLYTPSELQAWGTALVEALDQDGPEPDDRPPAEVNELHLTRLPVRRREDQGPVRRRRDVRRHRHRDRRQGPPAHRRRRPRRPRNARPKRWPMCAATSSTTPRPVCPSAAGAARTSACWSGSRTCRTGPAPACLDFGGTLSPESLRMLCCDAAVVPIVLGGNGQPLDVGRVTRTIPDGLRRAVAARDRGCAHPGCDRPPSWCEVHHIRAWEHGGPTRLDNW